MLARGGSIQKPKGHLHGSWHRSSPAQISINVEAARQHSDTRCQSLSNWFSSLIVSSKTTQNEATSNTGRRTAEAAVATSPKPGAPKRDFLEAKQVSVYSLVDSDEFKFDVPIYQRPYSWRTKQVYELLQDLLAAYRNKQEYFLGAIVATRGEDGAAVPYQLIDGQQRLTTLMMMVACLRNWAFRQSSSSSNGSSSSSHEVLQLRVRRMLYLEADPLSYSSPSLPEPQGRYRLRLQACDDAFFRANVLDAWLPTRYRFAGVAAASAIVTEDDREGVAGLSRDGASMSGTSVDSSIGSLQDVEESEELPSEALENETWWRIYENASFMQQYLEGQVARGLNLQDFMFHCLRNCYLVLMTARDEEASFRIFSTLNGRGMDLSVIDKLKADLLQVLNFYERRRYAAAWAEMEGLLGRPAFHRVFDYMRSLASASDPTGKTACLSISAYFTRQLGDAEVVGQLIQAALDYSSLLLQLRQARWSTPSLELVLGSLSSVNGSSNGANARLLSTADKQRIAAAQQAALEAQYPSTAALLKRLAVQSRYMNLFVDDAWLPAVLEFCRQCDNLDYRLRFLQAAEALQLHLELQGDAAAKADRWRGVIQQLMQQPMDADAVLAVVALTAAERTQFRASLDSKEYGNFADPRTTKHLLLRCEDLSSADLVSLDFSSLHLEKVAPQHAPEGSQWRKTKLVITHTPAAAATSFSASAGPSSAAAAGLANAVLSPNDFWPEEEPAASSTEVKYWYEVQRMYWHNTLGNLVLLPMATTVNVANADYDTKVALYQECGAATTLPAFSGSIAPGGKYGAHKFSYDDCRARHSDLQHKLVHIFGL